jgi:hypothetical protein
MTPLMHTPLIHDTLPIHFDKLTRAKIEVAESTSRLVGLVIDMVLYKAMKHNGPHSMAQQTLGTR